MGREIAGSLLDLFSSGRQFRGVHAVPDSTGMMSLMKSYHIFYLNKQGRSGRTGLEAILLPTHDVDARGSD